MKAICLQDRLSRGKQGANGCPLIRERMKDEIPVHSYRGRVRDKPIFRGLRAFTQDLFEFLTWSCTIDEFLASSSTAGREQVVNTLELVSDLLETLTYEAASDG